MEIENHQQGSLGIDPVENLATANTAIGDVSQVVTNPIAEQEQAIMQALDEIESIREAKLSGRDRAIGLDYLIAEIKRDVNLLAAEVSGVVKHHSGTEKLKTQEPEITNDDHER